MAEVEEFPLHVHAHVASLVMKAERFTLQDHKFAFQYMPLFLFCPRDILCNTEEAAMLKRRFTPSLLVKKYKVFL